MGEDFDLKDLTPPYNPWEQRLCLVPDDDLFDAMKSGKASVKTGHIDKFEAGGVRLKSGELIEADIIVTATGLSLAVAGKINVSMDGAPVNFADHFYYVCRVLNRMKESGATVAVPDLPPEKEAALEEDDLFDFSSGYIQRGKHIMPKSAVEYPWRLNQEYISDRKIMTTSPVEDGHLSFRRPGANAHHEREQLEAAE